MPTGNWTCCQCAGASAQSKPNEITWSTRTLRTRQPLAKRLWGKTAEETEEENPELPLLVRIDHIVAEIKQISRTAKHGIRQ
jgi:hypothetical protein